MAFRELKPDEWMVEIDNGLAYRRQYGLEDKWSDLEALYLNVHKGQDTSGPNLVYSTGDAILASLTVPNPHILIKGWKFETVNSSQVLESLDNMLLKDLDVPAACEDAVESAFLYGRGFVKIGYDSEFGISPSLNVTGSHFASLTQFDTKGRRIEFNGAKAGMPWIQAVMPHDIVVPWGTRRNLDHASWIAHRIVRHIDDVKSDPKYSHTRDLAPTMSMEDFVKSYSSGVKPYRMGQGLAGRPGSLTGESEVEFVEMWEIHDRRTGKIYVVAQDHSHFLRNETDYMQLDGLPFVSFSLTPHNRTFWHTSPAHYLRFHQADLNDIARQTTKQRRLMTLKMLAQKGAIEEDELDKMLSADVGAVAWAEQGHDLNSVIKMFNQSTPNIGLAMEAQQIQSNAREVAGFSRNQFGEFDSSSRRTATEALAVQQGSDTRMSRRQNQLKRLYTSIFRKLNGIIFKYWRSPKVIEIVGEQGKDWVEFTGPQLDGEYLYDVNFSNSPSNDLVSRQQMAAQLYQMMSQDPNVDPSQLKRLLAQAFNDPSITTAFRTPDNRQQGGQNADVSVQMQQLLAGGGAAPQGG